MKRLLPVLSVVSLTLVGLGTYSLPSQAQAGNEGQVGRKLSVQEPGQTSAQEFSINGTEDKVNPAAIVGAVTLSSGVSMDASQLGMNMALAGADPESVTNLFLALTGMVSSDNQVDPTRLALAINAFNSIVSKSDLATLNALNELPEFTEIRNLLVELRKAMG